MRIGVLTWVLISFHFFWLNHASARVTSSCESLQGEFSIKVKHRALPPASGEYTVDLTFEAGKQGFRYARKWLEDIDRGINAEKMTESIRGDKNKETECDAKKTPFECLDSIDLVSAQIDAAIENISNEQPGFVQKQKALLCAQERLMEYTLKIHAIAASLAP